MLPPKQFSFIATVYFITMIAVFVAMTRIVVLPVGNTIEERVGWFIVGVILTIISAILAYYSRQTEYAEVTHTKNKRACQAQRNSVIFSEMIALINGVALIFEILSLFSLVTLAETLTVFVYLVIVCSVWYYASNVAYAPLPRLPPPKKNV